LLYNSLDGLNEIERAVVAVKPAQKLLNKAIRYRNPIPYTEKPYKTTSPPIYKAWGTIKGRRLPAGVVKVITRGS